VGPGLFRVSLNTGIIEHCRAVLTRYAHPTTEPVPVAERPEPAGVTDEEKWYPGFADWIEREMPEGTVIGDPLWWASKIADYLQRHGRLALTPVPVSERLPEPVAVSERWLDAVMNELAKAESKHPEWPTDPLHAIAIIGEEFGELTQAVLQVTYEPGKSLIADVRREAVQTAAMALRFLQSMDFYVYADDTNTHLQGNALPVPGAEVG
jgi:NTP pyrophosphatase (non-canonical NTP hydrolase)